MPTQLYTAIPNDVITAARWNNEFGNLYNNVLFSTITATGTTSPRAIVDRFADVLNVKDYGAVGNGSVDDQTAIAAAVAAALTAGKQLFWPAGTYNTSATIANFHSVKHIGDGVLSRSGTLFRIRPISGQTNNLYVATTGSDTNDGLSSSQPTLTIQKAVDYLKLYVPLNANWVINIAAGTYAEAVTVPDHTSFCDDYLEIKGVTTATVQSVPTVIIDYPGSGLLGINCGNANRMKVSYIKFTDWLSPAAGGISADDGSVLWTYNVHTDNCRQGIVFNNCQGYVQGGILTGLSSWTTGSHPGGGGTAGVVGYAGSRISLGYGGTNAATGTILEKFIGRGLELKSHCHCVSTWATFASNAVGVFCYTNSRFDDRTNIFKKNRLCYLLQASMITSDQLLGASDYNFGETYAQGSADVGDGNFSIWRFEEFSTCAEFTHIDGIGGIDVCHQRQTETQTGTIAATATRTLCTIPKGALAVNEEFCYYEVFLVGSTTGATNTKTVTLRLGGVTLTTLTIATGTVEWSARITFWTTSNYTSVIQNTDAFNATITAKRATVAGLDAWADQVLEVWQAIPGAADTASLHECRVVKWG